MADRTRLLASLPLCCLLLQGCLAGTPDLEEDTGAMEIRDPSWETLGMLLAANTAPVAEVTDALALDRQGAVGFDRFRRGRDGVAGSTDDGRFESISGLIRETRASSESLQMLLKYARRNGYVVQHAFAPELIGRTLHATGPARECVTAAWGNAPRAGAGWQETSADTQAPSDVTFRVAYAGEKLMAELYAFELPGPDWVNAIARRPGALVIPFSASESGQEIWDAGSWGLPGDYLEVDVTLDATGIRFYFEVQCSGSTTCPNGGSETYCHAGLELDLSGASCETDLNDTPMTALRVPETTDPVEASAFDRVAPGIATSGADADWYSLQFHTSYDTCYACFLPYAALRVPGEEPTRMEVCVFVDQNELTARGPAHCEDGTPTNEGGLIGCCRTTPGPDAVGGQFDVGEVILWNEWQHHAGQYSTMYMRVRPTDATECLPYELVYGHFRG